MMKSSIDFAFKSMCGGYPSMKDSIEKMRLF